VLLQLPSSQSRANHKESRRPALNVHQDLSSSQTQPGLQLALLLEAQELPQDVAPAGQVIELLGRQVALSNQALEPLELLLGILFVCTNFREDLSVVLRVLVLEGSSQLQRLLGTVAVCAVKLLDDGVESFDGAAGGVKTAADSAVGASIGVQELDKVLLGAAALVGESLGAALLEVLDCGVGLDALLGCEGFGVLGFGIDLGDQDIRLTGEGVGEGLPDGGEGLAVCVQLARKADRKWNHIRPHHGAVKATRTS
jgi:hypothetical protein